MKKGIYLFQEKKFNRYCVRIGKRLTGKKEQKKRFPFSAHLPPGVSHYHLAKPEDQKAARAAARLQAQDWVNTMVKVVGTPGQVSFLLSPAQVTSALAALTLLSGRASLETIARDYVLRHFPTKTDTVKTVIEAYAVVQKATRRNADATLGSLLPMLDRFKERFMPEAPSDGKISKKKSSKPRRRQEFIPPKEHVLFSSLRLQDVHDFIASQPTKLSRNSQVSYLTTIRSLFRWAVEMKYIEHDIFTDYEMPDKDALVIATLTPEEVLRILCIAAAEEGRPMLVALALAAFCGIRREELTRMDWSDVNFTEECVTVSKTASKVKKRRIIKIRPNLMHWLLLCPNRNGRICPPNFDGRFTALVKKAGFVTPDGKSNYPRNALRHSFASYLCPLEGLGMVIQELGHSSPKMVEDHYNDLKFPSQGRAYFAIRPTTTVEEIKRILSTKVAA